MFEENVCCQNLTKLAGLTFLLMCIVNIYVILSKTLVTVLLASLLASAVVYLLLSS